jgi:hypothetical protein
MRTSRIASLVAVGAISLPLLASAASAVVESPRKPPSIGTQLAELKGSDTVAADEFGSTVAISDAGYFYGSSRSTPQASSVSKHTTLTKVSELPSIVTYGNESASVFSVTVATHFGGAVPNGEKVTVNIGPVNCTVMLKDGKGTCRVPKSVLSAGGYLVSAAYGGDGKLGGSRGSSSSKLTVKKDATHTTVSRSPSNLAQRNELIFSVTVTTHYGEAVPNGGKVTVHVGQSTCTALLKDGKGSCRISDTAQSVGSYLVSATYGGDANLSGSSGSSLHRPPPQSLGVRMETISANKKSAPAYTATLIYPQLTSGSQGGATGSINTALSGAANRVLGAFQGLLNSSPAETEPSNESSLTGNFLSDILNADFVSFTFSFYQYESGAAHGIDTIETFNFNARTGHQYRLADLFRSDTDWLGALSSESRAMLPGVEGSSYGDLSMFIDPGTTPKLSNFDAWALTPWGLSIQFQNYQVGPFAAGNPVIIIPYRSLQPLLSPTSPILTIEKAPPTRTILLPATTKPVVEECVANVSYTNAGLGPLTCPNGELNVNAWNDIADEGQPYLGVLLLGPRVTAREVETAMCRDVHRFTWVTAQMELEAERLGVLYHGWHFLTNPATQFPYYCPTK